MYVNTVTKVVAVPDKIRVQRKYLEVVFWYILRYFLISYCTYM